MKLWLVFKATISLVAIVIGAYIFSTMPKGLGQWLALSFMALLAFLPWFSWENYKTPTTAPEPPLLIVKNLETRALVTKALGLLKYLIGLFFISAILLDIFDIYPASIEAMIFLGGLFIIVQYLLKEGMSGRFGEVASGPYSRPLRIIYFICALALVLLMVVFYFAGIRL